MAPNPPSELVSTDRPAHPEFRAVPIALDPESAIEHICTALKGIEVNESTEGHKIRTTRGDLLAIIEVDTEGSGCILHYRTAPASATTTLKARKIWHALEPFEE